jgi:hypothetical protein
MKAYPTAQYLAGVMDSDGSFSITKRHCYRDNVNYTCMIQLTWTDSQKTREVIDFLKKFYGGSSFVQKAGSKNFKLSKDVIKYCATGTAAERICLDVRSYLILKSEQAKNLLEVRNLVRQFKGNRPKSISDKLEKLYIENKFLNSKNGEK